MNRFIIILLASFVLSSCHIYHNYQQPELKTFVDSLYTETTDSVSIASLSWTELFQDSLLQKLINDGLENNTDLGIAHLKIDEAKAMLLSSKLSFLPSLSLGAQGNWQKSEGQKSSTSYNIATSADWEIDIFGKMRNAKQESKAILEQSKAYEQAVQTQLIATIANSYYSLLMLDKQLEIGENTALLWEENLRAQKELKVAGLATEIAVTQAESNKLSLDASLVSLRQQINELENSLSALVGISGYEVKRSDIENQYFPEELNAGVPVQLLQNRPDVRQKEMELAACFYVTNQARASFYPSITLSGKAGWSDALGEVVTNPAEWLFSAIGSVVQPLFNRGQNIANLKAVKAREEAALLSFRQSLLDAGTEVNNALVQYQSANSRYDIHSRQVDSLRKVVDDTKMMMQHSSVNYLDVLTAQQSMLQAEMDLVSDRFDEIQGVINLYHALGGGVK